MLLIPGLAPGQSTFDAILKSRSLATAGNYTGAEKILTASIESKPVAKLYTERGDVKMMSGDYDGALNDYSRADELVKNYGDYGLSRVYALKGDVDASLRHLERLMNSPFKKSEKEVLLDPAFAGIEKTPQWRQFWKNEWYTGLETGISEIEYYTASGRNDKANEILLELQGLYKEKEEVEYARALISSSLQKYSEAVKILTGIKETGSSSLNEKVLRLLARAQDESSNPAGASVTWSKLLEMEVADAGLFLLRADCYRRTGETARAMADVDKYLSLYPHDEKGLRLAGRIKTAEGNHLKALEYFSENLKYHPSDPECYIDRGTSFMMLKSWEPAIDDYSMALDLDPSNSEVWVSKGLARINLNLTEDACHDFREALKLGNRKATDYISRFCIR